MQQSQGIHTALQYLISRKPVVSKSRLMYKLQTGHGAGQGQERQQPRFLILQKLLLAARFVHKAIEINRVCIQPSYFSWRDLAFRKNIPLL